MNIRKIGVWNKELNKVESGIRYTLPNWRKINGYKTRGYSNRLKRMGASRMIKGYPNITKHVKRNRTHKIVLTPINLNEAE